MKKFFCFAGLIMFLFMTPGKLSNAQQRSSDISKIKGNVITVGLSDADIIGSDNRAIQAAIDLVYQRGGGTVRILPGEYILHDAVRLKSGIHLLGGVSAISSTGDRDKIILKHAPAVSSPLLKDADLGQKEITPKDPSLFKVGMGVVCRDNAKPNHMVTKPLTIIRIENGVLYLNGYIETDFTADRNSQGEGDFNGVVVNVFPLIYGYEVENVIIEGLTIDSKVEKMPGWDDVRTGGVCLDRTKNCVVRNVKSVNNEGDGILVVTSEHTTVEDCEAAFNTHHGIHPGSHSPWTIVRRCIMHDNGSDGLYICWGVRESEFTDNVVYRNGFRMKRNGISTGHKDTDNLIARNHIYENAKHGIHFRIKTEANGAHRTKIIGNIIENNGIPGIMDRGRGIYISGITHDILIENNIIRETRTGSDRLQKNAVYLEPGVSRVTMINNKMGPHPENAVVDNTKSPDNKLQLIK